jgi:hypothetical protein
VGNVIAWVLISLAAVLLAFWAVRSLLAAASRSEMDLRGTPPAGQDWRYWVAQARSLAERGDYRSAIHAAYWGGIARLEEKQLLSADRTRTPRESLRMVSRENARAPLARLTQHMEFTWYGYRSATSADWDEAARELETLECLQGLTGATSGS